jgi:hypothetical protein
MSVAPVIAALAAFAAVSMLYFSAHLDGFRKLIQYTVCVLNTAVLAVFASDSSLHAACLSVAASSVYGALWVLQLVRHAEAHRKYACLLLSFQLPGVLMPATISKHIAYVGLEMLHFGHQSWPALIVAVGLVSSTLYHTRFHVENAWDGMSVICIVTPERWVINPGTVELLAVRYFDNYRALAIVGIVFTYGAVSCSASHSGVQKHVLTFLWQFAFLVSLTGFWDTVVAGSIVKHRPVAAVLCHIQGLALSSLACSTLYAVVSRWSLPRRLDHTVENITIKTLVFDDEGCMWITSAPSHPLIIFRCLWWGGCFGRDNVQHPSEDHYSLITSISE